MMSPVKAEHTRQCSSQHHEQTRQFMLSSGMSLLSQRVVHLSSLIVRSTHPPLAVPKADLVVPVRQQQIDKVVFHPTGSCAKDILFIRNQGLEVDNDN